MEWLLCRWKISLQSTNVQRNIVNKNAEFRRNSSMFLSFDLLWTGYEISSRLEHGIHNLLDMYPCLYTITSISFLKEFKDGF